MATWKERCCLGAGGTWCGSFFWESREEVCPRAPPRSRTPKGRPLEVPARLSAAHPAPPRPCLLPLCFQSLLPSPQPPRGPSDTPGTGWPQGLCTGCSLGPESSVPGGRGVLLLRALGCLLSCALQGGLCVPACPQLKTLFPLSCSIFVFS